MHSVSGPKIQIWGKNALLINLRLIVNSNPELFTWESYRQRTTVIRNNFPTGFHGILLAFNSLNFVHSVKLEERYYLSWFTFVL